LEFIPGGWGRCVATIGVFDGVHLGHQELIHRAVELAAERGVPSLVVTFDPHPAEVVRPGSHPAQLTTLRRKAELVEQLGVDVFCVLPFTLELSKVPADEFVHEVLVDQLHVAAVVVGENFTFGHKALGNVELLTQLGHRFGFAVEGAKLVTVPNSTPAQEITFSSTYIRACINAGDVTAAAAALGRPHRLEGIVVRGDRRGHELGFPTANLSTPRFAAVPADGVYAGRFSLLTAAGREPLTAAIDFVARLRDMERFESTEALVERMHDDVRRTRELLS
jgi:riboflavin kinase / FMN adenylyltransferase